MGETKEPVCLLEKSTMYRSADGETFRSPGEWSFIGQFLLIRRIYTPCSGASFRLPTSRSVKNLDEQAECRKHVLDRQAAFVRRRTVSMAITLAPLVAIRATFARARLTSSPLAVE